MVGGLDLLLVIGNMYLSLLSYLLQLIFGKAELDGVLVWIDFPCAECRHADVNKDDGLAPVSQWEWSLTIGIYLVVLYAYNTRGVFSPTCLLLYQDSCTDC